MTHRRNTPGMVKVNKARMAEARSSRGGFGKLQVEALGITWMPGWTQDQVRQAILGKWVTKRQLDLFIALRDIHLDQGYVARPQPPIPRRRK
jgi:hypothetical protein